MSEFKAVDNRKYNDDEIKYVVSRILANWDPEIIAKAFKRDHGDYWAARDFTKKQVAYIRTTYKVPPGIIKPYTGPIPSFSPSPSPEDGPDASAASGSKRKRVVRTAPRRSSTAQARVSDGPSSASTGRLRKGPKTHYMLNMTAIPDDLNYGEGPSGHGLSADPPSAGINANPDDYFGGQKHDVGSFEGDQASRDLSNETGNPSVDSRSPSVMDPAVNNPLVLGHLPDVREILPDLPIQSIETPQYPMYPDAFPPGCSMMGAVAHSNPHGVWYFNSHDKCLIWGGHRHDYNGGIWFTNEMGVTQCLLQMNHNQAVGFMLGVTAAVEQVMNMDPVRYSDNNEGNANAAALMRAAHDIVRSNVPDGVIRPEFNAPGAAAVRQLSETNRSMPPGHFWDPFHCQPVQFNMARGTTVTPGRGQIRRVSRSARPSLQPTIPPTTGLPGNTHTATGYTGYGHPDPDPPLADPSVAYSSGANLPGPGPNMLF